MTGWRHDTLGNIDRTKPIKFTFDGKQFNGFQGDTIASAMVAADIAVVGRSFKYHRPRGVYSAGSEEPNAIVDVRQNGLVTPNIRATLEPLMDGMNVRSVNAIPNAAKDGKSFLDVLSRFLPAGFYYKTFMRPGWMQWEPFIRRMAGLGKLDEGNCPNPDVHQLNASCDVLVVGSGPAGLAAASAAAKNGAVVWLVEDQKEIGGAFRYRGGEVNGGDWQEFAKNTIKDVESSGGRVLSDTTLWGSFDHLLYVAWERSDEGADRHWRIRAEKLVVATGAIERPLWFANNDLPGVMLAHAGLQYCAEYGAMVGKKIALATANDASYPVALALANAGADLTLLDARSSGDTPNGYKGFEILHDVSLKSALGSNRLSAVDLGKIQLDADCLLVSGGYTPSVHLWCQAGGKLQWNERCDALIPRATMPGVQVVGAANGYFDCNNGLLQGHEAGGGTGPIPVSNGIGSVSVMPMRPNPNIRGRQWIDFQNDVTLKDVALSKREGFVSVEHLKRYTTLGMATDQGKTSNFAGLAAMAELTGKTVPEVGTTTYRPPFSPVSLITIAGRRRANLFNPVKRLTLERQHHENGACFREYGGWLRPAVYGAGDEKVLAAQEVNKARETVGIYDASPLGKIEVCGPKAAELLDFVNYVKMSTLKPGRARYGFMLSEAGVVFDDGVVLRLDEERFIVSASSSHVDGVGHILEEIRQDRLGGRGVVIQDVTANWTTLSVTGPLAYEVLRLAEIEEPDLSHMGVAEIDFQGFPLRIARISFTGDKSYEISVPSRYSEDLFKRMKVAINQLDGVFIGLEAVMILRAEKGYILVGKDTDGVTMPHDLGWDTQRKNRRDEFQGKRSLFTDEASRKNRRQQVGLEVDEGAAALVTGSHLITLEGKRQSLGFVTSSYADSSLGRPIALGLLENGFSLIGERIGWFNNGKTGSVKVVPACAFDREGQRLNG